jgi:hypothetical protein
VPLEYCQTRRSNVNACVRKMYRTAGPLSTVTSVNTIKTKTFSKHNVLGVSDQFGPAICYPIIYR